MVAQVVSVSISGRQIARFLNQLIEQRGKPAKVICSNGTECASKAMFSWSKEIPVELGFIQPGKPQLNGFVERVNGHYAESF